MDIRTISEDAEDVEVTPEELMFHSDVRENIVSVPAGEASKFRFIERRKWVTAVDTFGCRSVSSAN